MLAFSSTLRTSPAHASASRELAIARSLLSLLEQSLANGDMKSAVDLAEQLTEHLQRIDARISVE